MSTPTEEPPPSIICGQEKTARRQSEDGNCPECGGDDLTFGYGLAAGGCGSYKMCLKCNCIFDAVEDSP